LDSYSLEFTIVKYAAGNTISIKLATQYIQNQRKKSHAEKFLEFQSHSRSQSPKNNYNFYFKTLLNQKAFSYHEILSFSIALWRNEDSLFLVRSLLY